MSIPREPAPGLVYMSVLASSWEFWDMLRTRMETQLGDVAYEAGPEPYGGTDYYDEELGTPVTRRILAFERLVPLDGLKDLKLWTNEMEANLAREVGPDETHQGRRCNLDPGMVTQERLVLATGKNYSHRIYLGQGIWGDLTLVYRENRWFVLPWTFPDYARPEMLAHMDRLRDMYRSKLNDYREEQQGI